MILDMSRPTQRIVAALLGLVFLAAAWKKLLDPAAFAIDILNYRVEYLPWAGIVGLALYLPWLELVCGLALILHVAYRGALCIAAGLLAVFIAAYGSTRPRGLDVGCGCFGHGVHRGYWTVLLTDGILLATAIWLLRAEFRPLSPVIRRTATPGR